MRALVPSRFFLKKSVFFSSLVNSPPLFYPHARVPLISRTTTFHDSALLSLTCFLPSPLLPSSLLAVIKTGVISQAAGSAYVEFDKTKVMCGVYGPRQGGKAAAGGAGGGANNEQGSMEVDVKLATFATPGARGKTGQGDAEREFSMLVLRALEGAVIAETFPKTSVDVYATVGSEKKPNEILGSGEVVGWIFIFHMPFFLRWGPTSQWGRALNLAT